MKKLFIFLIVALVLLSFFFFLYQQNHKINRVEKCEDCNVIIFVLDALRPDHLSSYGYYRNTSQNIDRFTENDILFKNAFSQSDNTFPSVTSIFTSTYPNSHGVQYAYKDKLSDKIPTLTQILKIHGYKTSVFASLNDYNSKHLFKDFDEAYNIMSYNEWENNDIFYWLENNSDKKFFLYYHSYNIHSPYLVQNPEDIKIFSPDYKGEVIGTYDELSEMTFNKIKYYYENDTEKLYEYFDKDYLEKNGNLFSGEYNVDKIAKIFSKNPHCYDMVKEGFFDIFTKSDSGRKHMVDLYDTKIYFEDQFLNRIFNKLNELNLTRNTIIIITADHGEEFYEHGLFDHMQLYDEVLHIPLIIKVPSGHDKIVIEQLVQSIDIMPTILDLVKIPINHESQGTNLLPLINDEKNASINNYIYAQKGNDSVVRSKEWKLYIHNNRSELYDIENDREEKINLIEKKQDIAEKLFSEVNKLKNSLPNYSLNESFEPNISNERIQNIIKTGYW